MKHGMRERLIGAAILIFLAIVFIPLFLGNKLDDLPLIQAEEIPAKPAPLNIEVNPFTQPPHIYEIGDDYLDKEMRLEDSLITSASKEYEQKIPVEAATILAKDEYHKNADNLKKQKLEASKPKEANNITEKPSQALVDKKQLKSLKPTLSATDNSKSKPKPIEATKAKSQLKKQGGGKMWAIQVASFSNSVKAREFLGRLEKQGFEGYWRKINQLAVVFVGPFTNNKAAQDTLSKLVQKNKGKYFVVKYINEFTAEKFGTLPPKNIRKSLK